MIAPPTDSQNVASSSPTFLIQLVPLDEHFLKLVKNYLPYSFKVNLNIY